MRFSTPVVCLAALVCGRASGQPRPASPAFEVASIRRTIVNDRDNGPFGCRGGPASKMPTRWICHRVTLPILIGTAYRLKPYQLIGDFLAAGNHAVSFDIETSMAEGATAEAFRDMQIDLLQRRFGLILHFEEREMPGCELTPGKAANKLKVAPQDEPSEETTPELPSEPAIDSDGFPNIPNSSRSFLVMMNGRARWVAHNRTMDALVSMLESQLRQPVIDATRLNGHYDFVLKWATSAETDDAPSLLTAVQEQLGLKIVSKRVRISVPVIDHIDRDPTPN